MTKKTLIYGQHAHEYGTRLVLTKTDEFRLSAKNGQKSAFFILHLKQAVLLQKPDTLLAERKRKTLEELIWKHRNRISNTGKHNSYT